MADQAIPAPGGTGSREVPAQQEETLILDRCDPRYVIPTYRTPECHFGEHLDCRRLHTINTRPRHRLTEAKTPYLCSCECHLEPDELFVRMWGAGIAVDLPAVLSIIADAGLKLVRKDES